MIRIVHSDLPVGLRLMVTREDDAVVITVSTRLVACAQRRAVRAGIAAARRAGWLRARIPAVVLIGPATWLADRFGRVHAAIAAGTAATVAVATVGVVAVTASHPAAHLTDPRPLPPAYSVAPAGRTGPSQHAGSATHQRPAAAGSQHHVTTVAKHSAPRPDGGGSLSPLPSPAVSPSPVISVSVGASPSPSPAPTSTTPTQPGVCLQLLIIGICLP
jgi:hypothetical protein